MKNLLLSQGVTNPVLSPNFRDMLTYEDGGESFLASVLPPLIGLVLVIGLVGFFFMFLFGAVGWIFSGGDKAHVENAKGRITSALIGVILLLSTFTVVKVVETFFGINILSIDIGPLVIQ